MWFDSLEAAIAMSGAMVHFGDEGGLSIESITNFLSSIPIDEQAKQLGAFGIDAFSAHRRLERASLPKPRWLVENEKSHGCVFVEQ